MIAADALQQPLHPLQPRTYLLTYYWRSMFREALEDRKRHADDKRVNNRAAKVLRGSDFVTIRWRDLRVGDVVCSKQ